jgi:hypothetical protein
MADDITIQLRAIDDASQEINDVGKSIGDLSDEANAGGRSVSSFSDALDAATGPSKALALGLAAAATAAVGLGAILVNEASNLNESINAVNVVFGDAADSVLKFGETAAQAAGLSREAFNSAVVPIGSMLQNMGASADQAAESSIALASRAADMASVFNTDLSEALTAIQAGLRGEADPLERFGVGLSETAVQAYALREGIISTGQEMDAQAKMTARLGLFFEQTGRVAGDFQNTSDELANGMRILKADFANVTAELGMALLPILNDAVQGIRQFIDAHGGADQIAKDFISTIKDVTKFLQDNSYIIYVIAGAIAGALVPALYAAALSAGAFVVALWPFLAVGAAIGAGIFLIIEGVKAFIQLMPVIGQLWGEAWDFIAAKVTEVWESIKTGFTEGVTFIVDLWNTIWDGIAMAVDFAVQTVIGFLTAMWTGITAIWSGILAGVTAFWNGVILVFNTVIAFIAGLVILGFQAMGIDIIAVLKTIADGIVAFWENVKALFSAGIQFVTDLISSFVSTVVGIWTFLWEGAVELVTWAWGEISGLVTTKTQEASTTITSFLTAVSAIWNSVWTTISTFLTGIWNSITSKIQTALSTISAAITPWLAALGAAWNGFWSAAGATVSSIWEGIKSTVKEGINWVISKINSLIQAVNSVISKGAGALGIEAITIATIPMLATGGNIVGAGDVIVGEQGPERLSLPKGARVTPLSGNEGGGGFTVIVQNNSFGAAMDASDVAMAIGEEIMRAAKMQMKFS